MIPPMRTTKARNGLRLLTSAEDILGASDIEREEVPTPEWGEGTGVLVQSMSATQRLAYEQAGRLEIRDTKGRLDRFEVDPNWDGRVALVVCSVVNEEGEPIFSATHVERLADKNAAPLDRIADVARRLSRMRPEDREEATDRLKATNGASPSG